jgi:hypothetical protein
MVSVCFGFEADLISGLCHEGQLETGVQAARKLRPDVSDDGLLALKTRRATNRWLKASPS